LSVSSNLLSSFGNCNVARFLDFGLAKITFFDGIQSKRNEQEVAMAIIQKDVKLQNNSDEAIRLNLVIQKCVAKNRDARFSTIAEMQNEFIEAMRNADTSRIPESAPHPGADSATKDFLSS
jgi:hypothetical protein